MVPRRREMSQSPSLPVGKRLRTMSSECTNDQGTQQDNKKATADTDSSQQTAGSSIISHNNDNTNQQEDAQQQPQQPGRNISDNSPQPSVHNTPRGWDVVGSQNSHTESRAGTSARTEPLRWHNYTRGRTRDRDSTSNNGSQGNSISPALFYSRGADSQSDPGTPPQRHETRNDHANNNSANDQPRHHYDEVIDERIASPTPSQAAAIMAELDAEDSRRDAILVRARRRNADQNLGNLLMVNFFREHGLDSDEGQLVVRRAWNDRDFDIENDSFDIDSDDDDEAEAINHCSPEEYLKYDPTPDTPYPKPDWITLKELRARKCGFASSKCPTKRPNMYWFQRHASNSLWMIQRLQLERKLQSHTGCVNSLDFNGKASLLCSGSDDLAVCIWDWQRRTNQLKAKFNTGHVSNVLQTVFCNSDTNIVTSSRDGQVRLLDIQTGHSSHLLSASGEIGKLTFTDPNTILTCGTNANVNMIDLRTEIARKLFTARSPKNNRTCPLHSIDSHPIDKNIISVAGSSQFVFLYDLRRLPRNLLENELKPKSCLGVLDNPNHIVTSTAFNSTGDKLLVSYNYDDLYVFKTDSCEVVHKYKGHRNKRTIKGCAWFGDNYVLSGSDDGHIYGWDLESEHIVCFLEGDRGVVNTLCVHPTLPILASSGLDHDVKIWEPISNTWPQTMKGIKPQICKNSLRRKRATERRGSPTIESDDIDSEEEGQGDDDEEDDDEDWGDWVITDEDRHSSSSSGNVSYRIRSRRITSPPISPLRARHGIETDFESEESSIDGDNLDGSYYEDMFRDVRGRDSTTDDEHIDDDLMDCSSPD